MNYRSDNQEVFNDHHDIISRHQGRHITLYCPQSRYELGVGSKPIPRKNLNAENLSDAIQFISTNGIKEAAKNLGLKIQGENGAEQAARIISNCFMP